MEDQLLDNMDLEQGRGITIKARAVRLTYKAQDGEDYELNLIDTPGHVDFNYEVSRSLAPVRGAVLVVDSTQGVEAQTLANTIWPWSTIWRFSRCSTRSTCLRRIPEGQAGGGGYHRPARHGRPEISAKMGINIEAVLEDVVKNVPPPPRGSQGPLKALIFDSQYDSYRGVIVYFRIMEGTSARARPGEDDGLRRPIRSWSAAICCPWAWSPARPRRPARWAFSPPPSRT